MKNQFFNFINRFSWGPRYIRKKICKRINLEEKLDSSLIFKVAETHDEFEQAFQLLHDAYVAEGYMEEHPEKVRVTSYHALPTTTILIAKLGEEVVGTVSIIKNGDFGLPVGKVLNLNEYTRPGEHIGEVSSLAIKKGHNSFNGKILFPLFKFMYEYSCRYFDLQYFVIAHHPKWKYFYQSILGFEQISEYINEYEFAQGAPAIVQMLNLKTAVFQLAYFYYGKNNSQNIWHYFHEVKMDCFQFPERFLNKTFDSQMGPDTLNHFFNTLTDTFETLEQREKVILSELYTSNKYQHILPIQSKVPTKRLRQTVRMTVDFPCRVMRLDGSSINGRVINASTRGLMAQLEKGLEDGESIEILVRLEDFNVLKIKASVKNIRDGNIVGMSVEGKHFEWVQAIQLLCGHFTQDESKAYGDEDHEDIILKIA